MKALNSSGFMIQLHAALTCTSKTTVLRLYVIFISYSLIVSAIYLLPMYRILRIVRTPAIYLYLDKIQL